MTIRVKEGRLLISKKWKWTSQCHFDVTVHFREFRQQGYKKTFGIFNKKITNLLKSITLKFSADLIVFQSTLIINT